MTRLDRSLHLLLGTAVVLLISAASMTRAVETPTTATPPAKPGGAALVPARAADPAAERAAMMQRLWWNQPSLIAALGLSDEQRGKMDQLFTRSMEDQHSAQLQQPVKRRALEDAIATGNWQSARTASAELNSAMNAMWTAQTELKISVLSLLSDQQRQTLSAQYASLLRRPWGMGPPVEGIHLRGGPAHTP
jgi:hypothetical protein